MLHITYTITVLLQVKYVQTNQVHIYSINDLNKNQSFHVTNNAILHLQQSSLSTNNFFIKEFQNFQQHA